MKTIRHYIITLWNEDALTFITESICEVFRLSSHSQELNHETVHMLIPKYPQIRETAPMT